MPADAYYNENDPRAAATLRVLVDRGLIAKGVVDERSISDVSPADLAGYGQCHFFAGIGVWSYALRLAGVPDHRPVWTGSCPCQPFSTAGKGGGFDDERHLWPHWHWLISQYCPDEVLGEQVASKDGLAWFDLVSADMEGSGYAIGAVDSCAAGFGAPHIRQRLYFGARRMADADSNGRDQARGRQPAAGGDGAFGDGATVGLEHATGNGRQQRRPESSGWGATGGCGEGDIPGPTNGFWRDADWLLCRDLDGPRWRPAQPGTFPLAHGAPHRLGRLRGYGNGIVAQAAAEIIKAYRER